MKKLLTGLGGLALLSVLVAPAFSSADTQSVNFESPTYTLGSINGQDGWMATGPYDQAVASSTGIAGFGAQSLRISDATTSGGFGDQTFAKPLINAAGEASSTAGTFSVGTLQSHFEMQFDLASVLPTLQTGMHLAVSPDRGDGSRMSYLRFEDQSDGIHIFFDDVTNVGPVGSTTVFNESQIATTTRATHTIKMSIDFVNGPSNDVVHVWIDGVLVKTGTTWENYYRYDPEAIAEQSPRIVKTVLFRESGTAHPANAGKGFFIDNLSLTSSGASSTVTAPTTPVIITPANNSTTTSAAFVKVDWTDSTGSSTPITYQYQAFSDPAYTALLFSSGGLSASEIATSGTPDGTYYVRVQAKDSLGNLSAWSNGSTSPYKIVVSEATTTATNTPPVVTLNGANPFNITVGQTFVDPGATATDTEDGALTVITTGTVNTAVVGTYVLTYTATDSGNLSASTTRTVNVNPVVIPPHPTDKDACKDGGWKTLTDSHGNHFKNQGQCVSSVVSHKPNR